MNVTVPESLCAPVSWELMVSLKVLSPLLLPRSVRDSCRLIFLMRSISGGMGGRDEGGGGAATVKPPCQRHKSKSRTLHAASWFIWYPLWLLDTTKSCIFKDAVLLRGMCYTYSGINISLELCVKTNMKQRGDSEDKFVYFISTERYLSGWRSTEWTSKWETVTGRGSRWEITPTMNKSHSQQ